MRIWAVIAVVVGCLTFAAVAGAATISIENGAPHFVASSGENNRIAFGPLQSYDDPSRTFGPYEGMGIGDQTLTITAGTGCTQVERSAKCDVQPNMLFTVE